MPSQSVTYTYDNNGGITIINAEEDATRYLLTESLKPGRIVDADGNVTQIDYGTDGNPLDETLPGGLVYHFQYNSAGQIIGTSDPLGNAESFTYQPGTNFLSSYTNALGATTSYSFDASGNVTGVTDPGMASDTYSYNAQGEMTGSTDGRQQNTAYTYNAAGQVTREQFSDGTFESFTYDAHGDVLTMNSSTGLTTYAYNSANQLSLVTDPNGEEISLNYNAAGRRSEYTLLINHQVAGSLFYNYSSAGQLTSVGFSSNMILVSYTYDGAGRLQSQTDENGQYTTYQYDSAGNLTQLTNQRSLEEPIGSMFTYTYDSLNRISTETSLDGTWGYTYDSDSQLIAAVFTPRFNSQVPAQNLTYSYDSAGNRLSTVDNGVAVGYTTNAAGEYIKVGSSSDTYDADGNLTFDGLYTYKYNSQNQLTTVIGNGTTTTYTYNGKRQVIAQTVNGTTTNYLIDPVTGEPIDEYSFSGGFANITAYDFSGLALVERTLSGANYTYSYDGTGSTVGLENDVATVVDSYAYDPFGNQIETSAISNPFTYLGESGAITGANGLVINGSTLLNTVLGRSQSLSGSLDSGSVNPYSFLDNAWSSRSSADGADFSTLATQVISGISARLQPQAFGIAGPLFASTGQLASSSFGSSIAGNLTSSLATTFAAAQTPGAASTGTGTGSGSGTTGVLHGSNGTSTLPPGSTLSGVTLANSSTGSIIAGSGAFTGTRGSTDGYQSTSLDPNSISGPLGFGPAQTIGDNTSQVFQIDFENLPTATAPAQVVTVTTQLDPGWDWHTFELHSISFDHQVITVPDGLSFYSTIYDERPIGVNLLVEITAGINPETGVVTWRFAGIDPNTGVAPTDPTIGVLPPDDASADGQGTLTYSIRPLATVPSGTVVTSQATVTFDTQPPIDTNIWSNTINTSQISTTLSVTTPTTPVQQVTLNWSATETSGGAGIAAYTVYASTDGGLTYLPFLSGTQLTSANYVVVPGRSYSFYVIAFDNVGESSSVPVQPQATVTIPVNVFSNASIFYNNSVYDGNNAAASSSDDSAIATDKTALLPGQTATFANYTSYSKGINGIMIDIAGSLSGLNAGDFVLTMGNSSVVSDWATAPAPSSISIRLIDQGALNRVTLIWPDNVIQNIWLSITILANSDTGLAAPVTFYFGNAIGESGNSTKDAAVNTSDSLGARGHEGAGVPITDVWDYNRDGKVDATDVAIAQQHGTAGMGALQLISPPATPASVKSKLHDSSGSYQSSGKSLASLSASSLASSDLTITGTVATGISAASTIGVAEQAPATEAAANTATTEAEIAVPEAAVVSPVQAAAGPQSHPAVVTGISDFDALSRKKLIHSIVPIRDLLNDDDLIVHV